MTIDDDRKSRGARHSRPAMTINNPPQGKPPYLKTCGMFFISPSTPYEGDWQPWSGLTMSSMVRGFGYDKIKAALLARGRPTSEILEDTVNGGYPSVRFEGETGPHAASMCDMAAFGHLPSQAFVRFVRSLRRTGTPMKIGCYFFNYQSQPVRQEQNPLIRPLDQIGLGFPLLASTQMSNLSGCFRLDRGENAEDATYTCGLQNGTATPGAHEWLARTHAPGYADAWAQGLAELIRSRYSPGDIDFVIVDNVLSRTFYGTASNQPALDNADAQYQAGQKAMMAALRARLPWGIEAWGNRSVGSTDPTHDNQHTDDQKVYSGAELPNRFDEFHFGTNHFDSAGQTFAHIAEDARIAARANIKYIMGNIIATSQVNYDAGTFLGRDQWGCLVDGPSGQWPALRDAIFSAHAEDHAHVMIMRTTSRGPCFYQPSVMAPLR